jgi:hypothetical protein
MKKTQQVQLFAVNALLRPRQSPDTHPKHRLRSLAGIIAACHCPSCTPFPSCSCFLLSQCDNGCNVVPKRQAATDGAKIGTGKEGSQAAGERHCRSVMQTRCPGSPCSNRTRTISLMTSVLSKLAPKWSCCWTWWWQIPDHCTRLLGTATRWEPGLNGLGTKCTPRAGQHLMGKSR